MKKLILSFVCIIGLAAISMAQGGHNHTHDEESKRKLEASKVAYITSYLDLSADEAANFWPVYNEYKEAMKGLYGNKEKRKKPSEMTDAEATEKLNRYITLEQDKAKLKSEYMNKFRSILSDKKVLMLTKAEGEFKRQVVKRYADRKRGGSKSEQRR